MNATEKPFIKMKKTADEIALVYISNISLLFRLFLNTHPEPSPNGEKRGNQSILYIKSCMKINRIKVQSKCYFHS